MEKPISGLAERGKGVECFAHPNTRKTVVKSNNDLVDLKFDFQDIPNTLGFRTLGGAAIFDPAE